MTWIHRMIPMMITASVGRARRAADLESVRDTGPPDEHETPNQ